MELLHYWNLIRKRLWLVVVLMCIAAVAAGYYVLNQPSLFRTSTTLIVNPATLDSTITYQLADGLLPLTNTYAEFMKTRSFAQSVAQQMQEQGITLIPALDEILTAINARYIDGTQLLRITATYHEPAVAKALADTTALMLVQANDERIHAQQQALFNAQSDTRRVQEADQLAEAINLLRAELDYYDDQIQALERHLTVMNSGPQTTETDEKILEARNQILEYRSARVELLGSLATAQESLLAETEKVNDNIDTVVIVEEAWLPTEALPHNFLQPFLAAIAGAIALGIALAIGLEYLDSSVKSPEELDLVYGMPTLGTINIINEVDTERDPKSSLIMLNAPHTPVAENLRVLRTAVRMGGIGKPLHSLLVTSAKPGEGKSFVAANLALSMAQAGKQVILVDADLRRPTIHKMFGVRNEPGFTNLLVDEELGLAQVLYPTKIPNLQFLASGTIPPNPAELLSSEQAIKLMQTLAEQADLVIYDSSPAATVTDAVIIAPHVDGVIQIVNSRGTHTDLVLRCKELLERSGAHIIGAVLNQVAAMDLGYHSNYYNDGYYWNESKPLSHQRRLRWSWPWAHSGDKPGQDVPPTAASVENKAVATAGNLQGTSGSNPFRRSKDKRNGA